MKIIAKHPQIGEPETYVTASASAAATALTVASNGGFTALDYTVIGKPGEEETTINKISTVSGATTINYVGDALAYGISYYTPVSFIKYNQIRFYMGDWSARYSTGSVSISKDSATLTGTGTSWGSITTAYAVLLNGKWYDIKSVDSATQITLTENFQDEALENESYALVLFAVQSGSTIAITISQEQSIWDDTDGLAEDYYRWEYYNSTTTLASKKSAPLSGAELISRFEEMEPEEDTLGAILNEVYDDLEVDEDKVSRKTLISKANNCIKDLTNAVVSVVGEDYLNSYKTISLRANVGEYPLPDDFKKLNTVWIAYSSDDYVKATPMNIADDIPNLTYSESDPYYYLRGNMIGVKPEPTAANTDGIKMWQDKRNAQLKEEVDVIPDIFKDYRTLIIEYLKWRAYGMPSLKDSTEAQNCKNNYMEGKKVMLSELKDRDLDKIRTVEITQDIDLYE